MNLNAKLGRADARYPRKNHNGLSKFNRKEPKGHPVEKVKATKKGAIHRVNPPGTGGIARKLMRKAAAEGRI